MISEQFNFFEFITKVKNQDVSDIILEANAETTAAERFYHKHHRSRDPISEQSLAYAQQLKLLINYLRYGVRASGLPWESIAILQHQ